MKVLSIAFMALIVAGLAGLAYSNMRLSRVRLAIALLQKEQIAKEDYSACLSFGHASCLYPNVEIAEYKAAFLAATGTESNVE